MDAAGELFAGLLALGANRDVGAFGGQSEGQSFADAAAGSGDGGNASSEIGMEHCFRVWHSQPEISTAGTARAWYAAVRCVRATRSLPHRTGAGRQARFSDHSQ